VFFDSWRAAIAWLFATGVLFSLVNNLWSTESRNEADAGAVAATAAEFWLVGGVLLILVTTIASRGPTSR
jgi:hypothetical protein